MNEIVECPSCLGVVREGEVPRATDDDGNTSALLCTNCHVWIEVEEH